MRKTNSLLPNVTFCFMGLLLNMASLSYQVDGSQDFRQYTRTGIATFIRAPEQFHGPRNILTGTDTFQQEGVHSNELSSIGENKSFDNGLNVALNAEENPCPEMNEKHDLLYLLSTGCNNKKSMSQNAVSSALFTVDAPDSRTKQSKKYLRVDEAEDANSDPSKVQKANVAYPIHFKATYVVENGSEHVEATEATSMVHDNIMKEDSKNLDCSQKEMFEKYATLSSVVKNTLEGTSVLEEPQVNINKKQDDFTKTEKQLIPKLIIRNPAADQGSVAFTGNIKGKGEKWRQAEILLDTNENLETKEINCNSEVSTLILEHDCNERQTAESIAGLKSKHTGESGDISRLIFNAKFKKFYPQAELMSFLSGSHVVPKIVQVIREIPSQKFVKGERIRRRKERSYVRDVEKINDANLSRFFRPKFHKGPNMFDRRFTRSMNKGMKSTGASLNSLRQYRLPEFTLRNTIDEKAHLRPRKIATINDYDQELVQDDLNIFLHRMEMLANHIDKLHERYLRYNELNDDYISEELPSVYYEK